MQRKEYNRIRQEMKDMGKRVRTIALSLVLCAALMLCSGGVATADPPPSQVFVIYVCGDRLVYDAGNDVYFYPHLLNMLNMTKPEQQAYADQLNANAYGQITDWHFANLREMMDLLEAMTGHTIIPGERNNAPCSPSTDTFFPVTGITSPFGYPMQWTMGRTAEEAGVPIQVPDWVHDGGLYGGVYNGTDIYGGHMYFTTVPTEGQYHWAGTDYLTFDNDLNWVADDALIGSGPIQGDDIPCSAWFVSETGPPRPNPNSKYLHSVGGLFNITDPVGTQWHELWPFFCKEYHLSGWEDNGDGVLSHCDWIDIYEKPDGELRLYHVEDVTITLNVTLDGQRMFIELEGGYDATVLTDPMGSEWHEIHPCFCTPYRVGGWGQVPDNGVLDPCDNIMLVGRGSGEIEWWHVEDVAIDIIVTPETPPVGGEAYPVSKASVLAPWIAVGAMLAGGISWYVLRRRRAES